MMKRLLLLAVTVTAMSGCTAIQDLRTERNEYDNPFYAKYLNTGSQLDAQITQTLEALRADPGSPELHNQLGALLLDKGFPKDAEREFERAVNADRHYYPAWYNLGLVRATNDDDLGARRAFARTVDLKPGHAAALFQLGLIEEERDHIDRAIALYAKAFNINPQLLDVRVNPRILDTKLMHMALLRNYPAAHAKRSLQLQGGPAAPRNGNGVPPPQAPSPQPAPENIVTPAPPATDPAVQPPPPTGRNAEIVPVPRTPEQPAAEAAPAAAAPATATGRARRRRPFSANPQNPPPANEEPQPEAPPPPPGR